LHPLETDMSMLFRLITAGFRALMTVQSKYDDLKWRRVQHGEQPTVSNASYSPIIMDDD